MNSFRLLRIPLAAGLAGLGLLVFPGPGSLARGDVVQLGVGVHYWRTLDDIEIDDLDRDGLAWMVSARFFPESLVSLGLEVEQFPEEFAPGDEAVYAPAAYLVLGRSLYAAVGVGGYYRDGDFADDPFYAARLGIVLEALPQVFLDLNANYRFEEWEQFNEDEHKIDTDTVTLGAALRIQF